jgi:hypothetical protein
MEKFEMKVEQTNLLINVAGISKNPQFSPNLSDKKAFARDLFEFSQKSIAAMSENVRKTPKKEKNKMNDDVKAFAIAARIMSGDKVPLKDEKFLREYDIALYTRAKMFAIKKIKTKKHKSVLEEEKDDNADETDTDDLQNLEMDSSSVEIS